MCVFVIGVGVLTVSIFICIVCYSVPALPRPGFLTGAGGLPPRLGFSCMCAARVPVSPAVGAVPLCLYLVPRWHRGRCGVLVRCMYSGLAEALPFMARVALLAYVGGLAMCVPLVVSCPSSCLLMHSEPSRLSVTQKAPEDLTLRPCRL